MSKILQMLRPGVGPEVLPPEDRGYVGLSPVERDGYDPTLLDGYILKKDKLAEGHHLAGLLQHEFYFRKLLAEECKQTALLERLVKLAEDRDPANG